MPVVNIGTASNLFHAFEECLGKHHGLDFSKVLSFMSDTTNVMKRVRSGVQKLINNRNPFMPYAGCICYLADLAVKAGMRALPVGVEQLFVDIFYIIFSIAARENRNLIIYGLLCMHLHTRSQGGFWGYAFSWK